LFSKGREFFADRITIPIRDAMGGVIGFSARKYKEETFGGKYINTAETLLFKKSKVLFGLFFSRNQIAKERKVLIVEGQIDALRLIYSGFAWTVAGQGTAFGEEMAKELIQLGVKEVFLALDGDDAGREASCKIGNLFQKEGIEVFVVPLPEKWDPDLFLQEKGAEKFKELIDQKVDYLTFLVEHRAKHLNLQSPAGKSELIQLIAKQIREWDQPVMVHESLKKLAKLTHTPEGVIGTEEGSLPQIHIKRSSNITFSKMNLDQILEADLLRWLILMGQEEPKLFSLVEKNLTPDHFFTSAGKGLYEKILRETKEGKGMDLLSLMIDLESSEWQHFLAEILQKKINRDKAIPCLTETIQKMLERQWMRKREEIKMQIYSGASSEEEVLTLARRFDQLKKEKK
ncbi:MAG: toprim domain-containing protein, partial [Chlamydiia bacterium]|nr:toprim domain-containing protein [Chlamydiia bacterium]